MMKRREFLSAATASAIGTTTIARGKSLRSAVPIALFEKPLQSLSYEDIADAVKTLGFDGIEATVRAGGHVLPERVEDDLPKLVEALASRGLTIIAMASNINRADDKLGGKVLRTAAGLGIKRYRMEYYRYDLSKPVRPQIDALKPVVRDLAALNAEIGIQALYQNHAGAKLFGAPVWDLVEVLEGVDPEHLAVAYDIRHATAESMKSWRLGYDLIRPHVGMIYVKDFRWEGRKIVNVPLGKGLVAKDFFTKLAQEGLPGPVSLHVEYLNHNDPKNVPKFLEAFKGDLATLRSWIG